MTKKDLERRNQFLLLQLKIINGLAEECNEKTKNEMNRILGAISYYSDSETIKENMKFIEEYNETYNFYHKTMNIKDYE